MVRLKKKFRVSGKVAQGVKALAAKPDPRDHIVEWKNFYLYIHMCTMADEHTQKHAKTNHPHIIGVLFWQANLDAVTNLCLVF